MSADGETRKILIASSILGFWDETVAAAVMTYFPKKTRKPDFDGTINLPEKVHCQAYRIKDRELMEPCVACRNMFGLKLKPKPEPEPEPELKPKQEPNWPYGNCAEAESLSKLLKIEQEVKNRIKQSQESAQRKARSNVSKDIVTWLLKEDFVCLDFFSPQVSKAPCRCL